MRRLIERKRQTCVISHLCHDVEHDDDDDADNDGDVNDYESETFDRVHIFAYSNIQNRGIEHDDTESIAFQFYFFFHRKVF